MDRLEGGAREDLLKKLAAVLAFDFEAAGRLRMWDDWSRILDVRILLDLHGLY